jgi:predicted HicB family RNase H-like nuclease
MFSPDKFTISIRLENIEGENFYVARVKELPDVEDYGESYEEAHSLVVDTIVTAHAACEEQGISFPTPFNFESISEASGRITLRLPKSLHSRLSSESSEEGVSLNHWIVSKLSCAQGGSDVTKDIEAVIGALTETIKKEQDRSNANSYMAQQAAKAALIMTQEYYRPESKNDWNTNPPILSVVK